MQWISFQSVIKRPKEFQPDRYFFKFIYYLWSIFSSCFTKLGKVLEQNFGGSYWYLCLLIQQDDMFDYIMAGFINGLDQVNLVFWLATPVGKIQRLIFLSLKRSLALFPRSFNVWCVFYWPRLCLSQEKNQERTWPISSRLEITLGQ